MRDRHNIVGSEVGHPRPPIYTLRTLKLDKRRRAPRWALLWAGVAALLLLILVVAGTWR